MSAQGQSEAYVSGNPLHENRGRRHGRSRMLDAYLYDIEYLLRERLWNEAVPLALALPHICVALADPCLRSCADRYLQWCQDWVRPPRSDTSMSVPDAETLYRLWRTRGADAGAEDGEAGEQVPVRQLRRLRLRRLSRAAPAHRRNVLGELLRAEAQREVQRAAAVALVDAVRLWYGERAAPDAIVQTNLARLAVLR